MADRTSPAARNIYYNFTADRSSKLVRPGSPAPLQQWPRARALRPVTPLRLPFFMSVSHLAGCGGATSAVAHVQYVPDAMNATSVSPYDHRSFLRTTVTRLVRARGQQPRTPLR
jgi:hypothetical protein|eukprot:COSAG06_NODE_303_length_17863_cov_13.622326_14_plen_114_part_00